MRLIIPLAALAMFFIVACNNPPDIKGSEISASLVSTSACKNFTPRDLKFNIADTFSCVNYLYNASNNKVNMNHINAGFNCGIENISFGISENNDTIIIHEVENGPIANCLCLFDIEFELEGVDQQKYQVKFIEPNAEGMEELNFEMDLTKNNQGEFCVVRKGYPWGE